MTTAATMTRQTVMNRAWEIVRQHMQWNRFTVHVLARAMRDAWAEAKARAEGVKPICDMTPTEKALAAAMADLDSSPREEADLSEKAAQEAADMAEKRELIEATKGQICAVTFVKKSGELRTMKVQPAKLKFHVKGDDASEAAQRAVATRKANNPHLMPVWDVEAQAVRSVNLATIQTIAVDGLAHAYAA